MSYGIICAAIQSRNQISFQYIRGGAPGPRLVEPYMIAYNQKENLSLSAWFLGGSSESQEGQGWREYLLDGITNVVVLPYHFTPPRPNYNPSEGKLFHNIQCAV